MGRAPGEALWPEWEDASALERKRISVGPRLWQTMHQQQPQAGMGNLFDLTQLRLSDSVPLDGTTVRAWDLAATSAAEGGDPDWTVGLKLARLPDDTLIVLDVRRFRAGPNDVAEAILQTAVVDGRAVRIGLPQDPGQAGKQQVAWLTARLAGYHVTASPETGAKATRATPVAAQLAAGTLLMLRAEWNQALIDELREFPVGRKDDQVDALSRAFAMLQTRSVPARRLSLPLLAR